MLKRAVAVVAMSAAFIGQSGAALHDRGGGMIYDDVLKITWLQDANFAKTSGYATANAVNGGLFANNNIFINGKMGWNAAVAWADQLVYGGYADWRLPTMLDTGMPGCNFADVGTDCGYNVQTYDNGTNTVYSEFAYMYYVNLGLKPRQNPDGSLRTDWGIFGNGTCNGTDCTSLGQSDVGLIKNLQADLYWLGTEYAPNGAWRFYLDGGQTFWAEKWPTYFAWAVRDGDVASVPVPGTLALLGLGFGLMGLRRARVRRAASAMQ